MLFVVYVIINIMILLPELLPNLLPPIDSKAVFVPYSETTLLTSDLMADTTFQVEEVAFSDGGYFPQRIRLLSLSTGETGEVTIDNLRELLPDGSVSYTSRQLTINHHLIEIRERLFNSGRSCPYDKTLCFDGSIGFDIVITASGNDSRFLPEVLAPSEGVHHPLPSSVESAPSP